MEPVKRWLNMEYGPEGTPVARWQTDRAGERSGAVALELTVEEALEQAVVRCEDPACARRVARWLRCRGIPARTEPVPRSREEPEKLTYRLVLGELLPESGQRGLEELIAALSVNYTYMVECGDGTLYTGWTNDLPGRMAAHRAGTGSKYVRAHGFGRLAYYECHVTKQRAMRREWELKHYSREKKREMIKQWTNGEK